MTDSKRNTDLTSQLTKGSELFKYPISYSRDKKTIATMNPTDIPISTYTEMLNDGGIVFPLWVIKLPIIRNRWHYTNEDKDIEKFVTDNLKIIWAHLISSSLTSLDYGFSAFEKRFEEKSGMFWYKRFIDLMPEYVRINVTPDGSFNGLSQKMPGSEEIPVPVWKSFVVTHDKRFGNHYGRSQIRAAYRYWAIDRSAYNFHAIAMQDYSVPTAVGRAPNGQTQVGREENGDPIMKWNLDLIQELAESIHSRSALSFPSDEGGMWKLELLSDKKQVYWEFNKDHEFFDRMKSKAIFVPEEITQGKGGSYAKAEVQSRWLEEMVESIETNIIDEYIMPYVIEPLVTLNFFNGKNEPPKGKLFFSPLSESNRQFLQELFVKLFSPDESFKINWEELANAFNVPITVKEVEMERGESHITHLARELRTSGKISDLDKKSLSIELRRSYNAGLQGVKVKMSYDGYITMPGNDMVLLEQERNILMERLKTLPQSDKLNEMADYALRHSKLICAKMGEESAKNFINKLVK